MTTRRYIDDVHSPRKLAVTKQNVDLHPLCLLGFYPGGESELVCGRIAADGPLIKRFDLESYELEPI